jgi:hypothetical protein
MRLLSVQFAPSPARETGLSIARITEHPEESGDALIADAEHDLHPFPAFLQNPTRSQHGEMLGQGRYGHVQTAGHPGEIRGLAEQPTDDLQAKWVAKKFEQARRRAEILQLVHFLSTPGGGVSAAGSWISFVEHADPPDRPRREDPQVGTPNRGRMTQTRRK